MNSYQEGVETALHWGNMLLTAMTSIGDERASHPTPLDSYTTLTAVFQILLLMFSQSGICRDKVALLYLLWGFPGKIESSSIVERQSTPSGPIKQECAFLMVCFMEHAGSVLMCNWNKYGTRWYHSHFNPNSSGAEVVTGAGCGLCQSAFWKPSFSFIELLPIKYRYYLLV